ncbi:MAG TPA: hypothetical protein VFG81_16640 [Anaerolineales bacterium]|nr:hypothetical protein [Anaerolineales bacterium]
MNETYTRDQAMTRLGIKSRTAFKYLVEKYPEPFVLVTQGSSKSPRYDKAAIDRFAELRASLKARSR